MDLKGKTEDWLLEHLDCYPKCVRKLLRKLEYEQDFFVNGSAQSDIMDIAAISGYETVVVNLKDKSDLRGEPFIRVLENGTTVTDYDVVWTRPLLENPEKKYIVLFNIDNADIRLVNSLKSIIERHAYNNMLIGILCTDNNRNLEDSTIYDLVKPVIFWEEIA